MNADKRTARIAGLWYLLLSITAGFSWMHMTGVMVAGDSALTAKNIVESPSAYLASILGNIIGQIAFIFLVLALYRLLKPVDAILARLMLTLVVVSVPVMFVNIIFQTGGFVIATRADYLRIFDTAQRNALMMLCLTLYRHGVSIVTIFWGLWLFPFGCLVIRSGFLPKTLGFLLILSGCAYLANSFTFLFSPVAHELLVKFISLPEAAGEIAAIFWLLVRDIKVPEKQGDQ